MRNQLQHKIDPPNRKQEEKQDFKIIRKPGKEIHQKSILLLGKSIGELQRLVRGNCEGHNTLVRQVPNLGSNFDYVSAEGLVMAPGDEWLVLPILPNLGVVSLGDQEHIRVLGINIDRLMSDYISSVVYQSLRIKDMHC